MKLTPMKLITNQPRHRTWALGLLLGLLVGLTACIPMTAPPAASGGSPTAVATTVAEAVPLPETAPITETTAVTDTTMITSTENMTTTEPMTATQPMTDTAGSLNNLSAIEQQLVEQAIALVASETGMTATDLSLATIEALDWPDSSLGCPEPGMMYMQVITPGYRITLEDADGASYAVHTTGAPDGQMVLCTDAAEAASSALSGVLTGTVAYLQRSALPAGSVINVELQDVSRADAAATVLVSQTITTTGENVPIPFELTYDPAQVEERFSYAVRAQILIDGELRWTSTQINGVLTRGNPTTGIEVIVMPVE